MTRFVVGCETLLGIVTDETEVAAEHRLLAPTLVRLQALATLYEARRGGIRSLGGSSGWRDKRTNEAQTVAVVVVDGRAYTAVTVGLPSEGTRLDIGFPVVVAGARLLPGGSIIITAERDRSVVPRAGV